jgi:hypothetical protein
VNLVGLLTSEEVVIRELSKPERRYRAPHFTYDNDYLWLNAQTIVFKVYVADMDFYTIDAPTGTMKPVARETFGNGHRVTDFGVSGPQRFWYKTDDGETHEVTVEGLKPQASQ